MELNQNQIWDECLSFMSRRVNKQSFFTWLKPTTALSGDDAKFHIGVPNKFVADWLDEHYGDLIGDALRSVTNKECAFELVISSQLSQRQTDIFDMAAATPVPIVTVTAPQTSKRAVASTALSHRYDFDTFVVGDSNEFAYAASLAVAESPGRTKYNPLFIYGGVGLGKTHLAQAIGNHILLNGDGHARIIYVTSEKFTNEFITSITSKSVADFSNHYRSADVLIIDDIQFFTGKESTQEQFFHTFNTLHQNSKQVVLTSDRPPRDIKGLEERLLSRFSWGLVTDIQPPSLETRIAILQKKSESEGCSVPVEVLTFIADSVSTNIRDLEGCLTRLLAYASLRGREINVDLAQLVLKDTIPHSKQQVTIEQIQKRVAESCNLSPELMLAKKKTADVALARHIAMYLCRTLTSNSLKAIGVAFGGRDHSTVIHAHKTILNMMKKDVNLKLRIDQLINSLYI
ncbi:MAG: chromosomal replication initiator protein DnaA [candidate division Zixibacteria bacterium]|nr:chromosomal replication initiator protein DnaA [candidate division Zixibacteria bacterium]MBU1469057.1 chromosomal replication initiator protein DnaA [candidate division Zixibacteria bacterium]MBU2624633.1 chromosomal replication initiator protein DnaA [candidate division Zixibacteria bacterium]